MILRRLAVLLLLALGGVPLGRAAVAQVPAATPGDEIVVELLTMGQGEQVWERFGHNSLRVIDGANGTDLAYNWGMFDFAQPGFLVRFLTGETKYWMEGFPTAALLEYYRNLGRTVTVQRLALTPQQKVAIRDFVRWNAREENKWYRYDYFLDNCSTRLRDALDRALGGQLYTAWAAETTARSFRGEALRLVDGLSLTQQGMDIALGRPADRLMSAWEEGYVPMRLRDRLRTLRVTAPGGGTVPLVESETVWYESPRGPEATEPPGTGMLVRNLLIGFAVGALFAIAGWRARRDRRFGALLGGFGSLWAFLTGILGVILLLAWTATRHQFWYGNENLLLINPITLPLAVLLPLAVRRQRWVGPAFTLALAGAALAVVALGFKLLPGSQHNLGVIDLMAPMHLGMLMGVARLRPNPEPLG